MSVTYTFQRVHNSADGKPRAEFRKSEITEKDLNGPLRGFLAKAGLGGAFAQSSTFYACEELCLDHRNATSDPVNKRQFERALQEIKVWQNDHPPLAAKAALKQPVYTTESDGPHAHAA